MRDWSGEMRICGRDAMDERRIKNKQAKKKRALMKPSVVAHTCSANIQKAEAGELTEV